MPNYTDNLGLIQPLGSEKIRIAQINQNMDMLDEVVGAVGDKSLQQQILDIGGGIAIMANGNTHPAITAGQFVLVRNHSTLADGAYTANSNIAENATLSSSNLTAVPGGGFNALKAGITSLSDQIAKKSHGSSVVTAGSNVTIDGDTWVYSCGNIVEIQIGFKLTASTDTICTLDSSIRPSSNLWICAISNTDDRPEGNIIVYANGNVKAYGLTINKSYRIHVTYIK